MSSRAAACTRLYLHGILLAWFCHPFDRKGRDERLWNLACDVATEALIDSLYLKCVHISSGAFRKSVYARLREKLPVLTAEGIYKFIEETLVEAEISRWQMEFRLDDHSLWEQDSKNGPRNPNPNRKKWDDIRERMETEVMLFSNEASEGEGDLKEQLRVSNRSVMTTRNSCGNLRCSMRRCRLIRTALITFSTTTEWKCMGICR